MAASNKVFEVTDKTGGVVGSTFDINSIDIIQVTSNSDSDAVIDWVENKTIIQRNTVEETAAAVSTAAGNLFAVTIGGATVYLNADRVLQTATNGSGADIYYNAQKDIPIKFTVTESRSDIRTAIAAVVPDASGEFVTLAGDNTFSGANTFSQPIRYSSTTGITAFATGGQASATLLTTGFNNVTVCATAADSVKLPVAVAGMLLAVKNNGAAALAIFPNTGASIDAGGADASVTLSVGGEVTFNAISATVWQSDVTVNTAGDQTVNGTKNFQGLVLQTSTQTLVGAGAIDLVTRVTEIDTTGGAAAYTLADGAEGQRKSITMTIYAGNATITPTNLLGGTTIILSAVGQGAELIFTDGKWSVVGIAGAAVVGINNILRDGLGEDIFTVAAGGLNPTTDNTKDIGNLAVNPRDITASRAFIRKGIASTEGYGQWAIKSISASKAFAGGGTEVIPVQVPSGAKIIACHLRNDTILVGAGAATYSAAYSTGSTQAISSGTAFDKNTKVNAFFDENAATAITTGLTDITLTPNAGTLDTGTVTAVVYYAELTSLTDAA